MLTKVLLTFYQPPENRHVFLMMNKCDVVNVIILGARFHQPPDNFREWEGAVQGHLGGFGNDFAVHGLSGLRVSGLPCQRAGTGGIGRHRMHEPDAPSFDFLQIFSTGGTIDKDYFDARSEYEVGEPQIQAVFREAGVTFGFAVHSLMRKDSLEMTDADRETVRAAVAACPHRHILITHGTDTMTETAAVLAELAREQGKIIVLTGSMAPARFRQSDAEFNIGCAVGALNTSPPGVYLAMSGRVFKAGSVRKNREKGRFEAL